MSWGLLFIASWRALKNSFPIARVINSYLYLHPIVSSVAIGYGQDAISARCICVPSSYPYICVNGCCSTYDFSLCLYGIGIGIPISTITESIGLWVAYGVVEAYCLYQKLSNCAEVIMSLSPCFWAALGDGWLTWSYPTTTCVTKHYQVFKLLVNYFGLLLG